LSVNGNVAPEKVNPVPLTEAPFTVTAAVPVDDKVNVCIAAEFTGTLPKERLEGLMPKVDTCAATEVELELAVW
jgi:hypothetical protein